MTMAEARPRILVVGCGGIGGVVAAHLVDQGHDVTALTTNGPIADAINARGFQVLGEGSPGTVRGSAVRALDEKTGPFDVVLLATQPTQVEDAARSVASHLAADGVMVCFQNGLCEERVASIVGAPRVVGGVVAWGASMIDPGVYERTSSGGFVLGRLEGGAPEEKVEAVARLLEAIGPTAVTSNLAGVRWSKLAINCAVSSIGTVGGDRLGALLRHRFVRRLALEVMTEATLVARASNVRLEKVAGTLDLDWIALDDTDRAASGSPSLVAKHALLLAVGARYRRLRSSMLAAIERGRPPAVEFLNGEIVTRGERLGVATPVNSALRETILAIAGKRVTPSLELARKLYDQTRALGLPHAVTSQPAGAPPISESIAAPMSEAPVAVADAIVDAASSVDTPSAAVEDAEPRSPVDPKRE